MNPYKKYILSRYLKYLEHVFLYADTIIPLLLLFFNLTFCLQLLQRLLDDRRSTVEVIKREGEKIAATAEPADKVKILKQLSLLDSRWEALLNKAETR